MKLLRLALVAAAIASEAWGQDTPKPPVVPVASIVVPTKQPLVIYQDGTVSKSPAAWQVIEPPGTVTRTEGSALIIPDWVPGQKYTLVLTAIGDTVPPYVFRFATVTAPGSTPAPPKPPTPDNPPIPPAPNDGVVANMRVLVLYETADNMTAGQTQALVSPAIRDYLTAKCTKSTAGLPEWRFWDKDVDTANATPEWKSAMTAAKSNAVPLPKVVVFSGTTLVEAKTIVDEAGTLAYLKARGGN